MHIRFWGVRGSLPTPLVTEQYHEKLRQILTRASDENLTTPKMRQEFIADLPLSERRIIGGNTSCVEVRAAEQLLVFDMGSGLKRLGNHLLEKTPPGEPLDIHFFLSHTHWDHIMGLPFFNPAYNEQTSLTFYSPHPDLESRLRDQQNPRFFPVSLDDMSATKRFVHLEENEELELGDISIRNIKLHHPGDSYGYRVDSGNATFIYSTDSEYRDFSEEIITKYTDFFRGADVVAFDSQYTLDEAMHHKKDWGHSSAIIGVDLCAEANVDTLVLFHHEPENDDFTLQQILDEAREYRAANYPQSSLHPIIGYEGLELTL